MRMLSNRTRRRTAALRVVGRCVKAGVEHVPRGVGMATTRLLSLIPRLGPAFLSAVLASVIAVLYQSHLDDRRVEREYRRTQDFAARQLVNGSVSLPGVDLRGRDLRGLYAPGRDFAGANFTRANLVGATLSAADLTNAKLFDANLVGANFSEALLPNDWSHFDGRDELGGVTAVCYDASTTWPEGYEPPPADCASWGLAIGRGGLRETLDLDSLLPRASRIRQTSRDAYFERL